MPEDSKTPVPDTENVITKFERSPPFQTYLVAFIVSDFEALENLDATPPQRVFTVPGKTSQVAFALEHGVSVMKAFEDYLGVEYFTLKMDQISIPDFASGAMENVGLVTYREENMLYDVNINTVNRKLAVAEVVAHEFAHQWFGNLVSPSWWQYLWLNEGFARFFGSYGTGLIYPEWREMETFVAGRLQNVMQSDALDPQAMSYYVENPTSIANLFNDVVYSKAGSVLRMLQHVVTDATFAKGLKLYLEDRRLNHASPEDLYRNMQEALDEDHPGSGINIGSFMTTWEMQPGFPVIHVSRTDGVITVSQSKYLRNSLTDPTNSLWTIPLNYIVGSNPSATVTTTDVWLTGKDRILQSNTAPKSWTNQDWILFNIQEVGFYRVNYDLPLWNLLSEELSSGDYNKFHPVNRAQLLDDSFDLARTQRLSYVVPMEIMSYLKNEDDYIPWAAFNRAMNFLHSYLVGSTHYELFRELMRDSADKFYTSLGAESKNTDAFLDKFGRNLAINWACSMGHERCLRDTSAVMAEVVASQSKIEPDLESITYCNGLRTASQPLFNALWTFALLPEQQSSKTLIMNSLGCSYNPDLINSYLASSINPVVEYTAEDRARVISAVYTNGGITGYDLALSFVSNHYVSISSTISTATLANFVNDLASRVSSASQFAKLESLITSLQTSVLLTSSQATNYLNTATTRMAFINVNVPIIEAWLEAKMIGQPDTTSELPLTTIQPDTTSELPMTTDSIGMTSELPLTTDSIGMTSELPLTTDSIGTTQPTVPTAPTQASSTVGDVTTEFIQTTTDGSAAIFVSTFIILATTLVNFLI